METDDSSTTIQSSAFISVSDGKTLTDKQIMAKKAKEFENIMALYEIIYNLFNDESLEDHDKLIDLDFSSHTADVLSKVYHCMRKLKRLKELSNVPMSEKTVKIGVKENTIKNIIIEYTKKKRADFDYSVATPIVDLLTAFKLSWDEARAAYSNFKLKNNKNGRIETKKLSSIGLSNVHIPQLTGLTYKPERRFGLIMTQGALTQAILLANETQYKGKLEKALKASLMDIPMCDKIVECLSDMKDVYEACGLLRALGDVLLITGSRSNNKIYFPILFIYKIYKFHDIKFLEKINFTDHIAQEMYNKYHPKFTWRKMSAGISSEVAQIMFHAMFGTSAEDLGILGQITNHSTWNTRNELNNAFQHKANGAKKITFNAISFKYFATLESPNIVENRTGNRKRNYTGELMCYGRDVMSLAFALNTLKESLIKQLRSGQMSTAGTVPWLKHDGINFIETKEVFAETGKYFF